MLRKMRAQSFIEYLVLIILVVVGFTVMKNYLKRGFSGRWKQSVDDLGEQYDPAKVNSLVNYTLEASSQTLVEATPITDPFTNKVSYVTVRTDTSSTTENKLGNGIVGK